MKFKNVASYLKKKHDCLVIYEYSEVVCGTTESIVQYYMLLKDYSLLKTNMINKRIINEYLYGKECINWNYDTDKEKALNYNRLNKHNMSNLINTFEIEEQTDGYGYDVFLEYWKEATDKDIAGINKKIEYYKNKPKAPIFMGYRVLLIDIYDYINDNFTRNKVLKVPEKLIESYEEAEKIYLQYKEYFKDLKLFKRIKLKKDWIHKEPEILKEDIFENCLNIKEVESKKDNIQALIQIATYGTVTGCLCTLYNSNSKDFNLKKEIDKLCK